MEDRRKPFGVWLIFVVSIVTFPSWVYDEFQKISSLGAEQKYQWLTLENIESFIVHGLLLSAAMLMFCRRAISRWMFLILFALAVPSIGYRVISSDQVNGDQAVLFYSGILLVIAIYGSIAYYGFRLRKRGYYSET